MLMMSANMISHVAISGATGFVGKNLKKFFTKNQIKSISLSRNHFKKNQFPILKIPLILFILLELDQNQ